MTAGTALHPEYTVGTWTVDPAHSEISFTVKHLQISKVRGFFRKFDVTITTTEDFEDSTIEAVIDVASVDTNQEQRDNHLRTGDFFLVEEYPTATFKSTAFAGTPDDFTVTGDFTLRGVTKSIALKGEFGGIEKDGYGRIHAGATATTKINRKDFGVEYNAVLESGGMLLGDEVTLNLDIQVILQQ
ncbi:MAG: YceI family protein [Microbacterium sp.]|nr:YceI family protein [Microbacterium sp.]